MHACSRTPHFLNLALAAASATFAVSAVAGFLPSHGLVRTAVVSPDFFSGLPAQSNPEFGYSVSIDGDWMAVGAPGTIYLDKRELGFVFLYKRQNGVWIQDRFFTQSIGPTGNAPRCGESVALNMPFLAYSCPGSGDPDPGDPNAQVGAVVVHELIGENWHSPLGIRYGAYVNSRCGQSVAVSKPAGNGTVVVAMGCPGWDADRGYVRTILFDAGVGNQSGTLSVVTASDGTSGDRFGESLALYRSTFGPFIVQKLAVGAPYVEHGSAFGAGSSYVFEGGSWTETGSFHHLSPDNYALTYFGTAVAIRSSDMLVGVTGGYTSTCQNAPRCGTVEEFEDDSSTGWGQIAFEFPGDGNDGGNPPGAQQGMKFGAAVAYGFDGLIAIGAPGTDGFTTSNGVAEDVGLVELRIGGSASFPLGELRPGPIPPLALDEGRFGASLDFSGDTLAVGYPGAGGIGLGRIGQVWLYQYDVIFADGFD